MHKGATIGLRHTAFSSWLLGLLLLAATAGAQTNWTAPKELALNDAERAWLQKHPVVYWGADPHWPPFSSLGKQGRLSGIDVDVINLVAHRAGLNLKLIETPTWSETLARATAGQIDFVGGIAHTEERERLRGLRFTKAFCTFPTAIVTRKDMPFMTSLEDLRFKRIALPRDYATTEELQKAYPQAHFVITGTEEQSMLVVAGGQADATVLNLASASYVAHMCGLANLKISGFTDLDFFLRMAVSKDEPELLSILEKGLATLDKHELESIYAGYINPETRNAINWRVWRRRTLYSILIGSGALIAALLWNRSLAREIQRREKAESALLATRDNLEAHTRELDRRATAVQQLNEKLAVANQGLESFSYSVAHDLKSPLRRVRSFADLLQEETGARLGGEGRQCLRVIGQEARRMDELIEALLAFARIGRAQMRLEKVNMERLVREVVAEREVETKGRDIVWDIKPLPEVLGERQWLRQALSNLIDNAVKFTRGRAPARLEVGALPGKLEDKEVVFYVKDNGAGFDPSYAGRLFEAFYRLHNQEEFEGSGIGLATVQRIIEKHGGRVWAEGLSGEGATFYFSLPRLQS
jgi:signal transduction histidine kinase